MIELPDGTPLAAGTMPGANNFKQAQPNFKDVIQVGAPPTTSTDPQTGQQVSSFYWDGSTRQPVDNVQIDWADLSPAQKKQWVKASIIRYSANSREQAMAWAPGFFADSVDMSARYLAKNQYVTPLEAAKKYIEYIKSHPTDSSSGASFGGGAAAPTVSGQNMQRLADSTMQQFTGREATNAEGKALTREVRRGLASDPTNTDPTYMAEQFAKNTPGATEYAANNYMKVFLQSLGGLGG